MWQTRAGPGGGLVVQLRVPVTDRLGRAVVHPGTAAVAVADLDAVRVDLVVDPVGRGGQRGAPGGGLLGVVGEAAQQVPLLRGGLPGGEAQRRRDAEEVHHAADRTVDDLAAHRQPLGLIGVQQRGRGRAVQHQLQLPAEVEGVRDRRVQPEAVGRRHLVHRVADAEHPAVRVAGGDDRVDLPRRDVLDPDVDGRVADALPDVRQDLLVVVAVELRAVVEEAQVDPFVPGADADEHPAVLGRVAGHGAHVQDGRAVGAVLREVRLEPDRGDLGQPGGTLHGESGLLHHPAPRTVGADHVVGAHGVLQAGLPVGDHGRDAVLVLLQAQELLPEAEFADPGLPDLLDQQRLQQVLREVAHRARAGRQVVADAVRAVAVGVQPAHLGAGEGRHEDVVGQHRARGRLGRHLRFDTEVAQDLAGALVQQVSTGGVGRARVLADHQVGDAVARERQRGGQAGRTGADDQYRDADVGGGGRGHFAAFRA